MPHAKFIKLTKNEEKIINLWRTIQYGEMVIKIQDGKPQDFVKIERNFDLKKI